LLHPQGIECALPSCGREGGSAQTDFSGHPQMLSCQRRRRQMVAIGQAGPNRLTLR
jgi:hypothetical protein